MKLRRSRKPPTHIKRQNRPAKGLPTPARLRLNVAQTRARSGRKS